MRELLAECIEGKTLTETQAEQVMNSIMTGNATPSQIASLVSIMRLRGETVVSSWFVRNPANRIADLTCALATGDS